MKKVLIKMTRVVCYVAIVLDLLGAGIVFYALNTSDYLGYFIANWQENFLDLSNPDARVMNNLILFFVVPLLILIFVKNEKKNKKAENIEKIS